MKVSLLLLSAALATSTSAIPLVLDYSESTIAKLKERQSGSAKASIQSRQSTGTTANEFLEGGCRDVIFIFARGSTQGGNIGDDPGPQTIDQLKAALVVSGYSQGAALVHRSVESASNSVKDRIYAIVTFGDTQKAQDGGQVPNFDPSKTLILCHDGDKVCEGTLIVTDAHHEYHDLAPEAVDFIVSKV
ncbi:carbohydrate esterase family 5 protein [Hypoxylon sp. CO27-5]|nr:carbohydrate esterase family 5 protein [Hypoxylon sp. CO27-5]